MKRFSLMVASGAMGLALLAGVTRELAARDTAELPPLGGSCYYYLYTCSYDDGVSYWSGCQGDGAPGYIPTSLARTLCTIYHGGGN